MTLAKALGGGLMPIGAVLSSPKAFSETFALKHSSTFAACSGMSSRTGRPANADGQRPCLGSSRGSDGAWLKRGLLALQRQFPQLIAEVRGRGFLLGIRFTQERESWPESLLGVALEQEFFTPLFSSYMLNVESVRVAPMLNGKSVIRIEPALNISRQQCERLLAALQRTLAMFATGDTGRIMASILAGRAERCRRPSGRKSPGCGSNCEPPSRRFAFLMHPLNHASAVNWIGR